MKNKKEIKKRGKKELDYIKNKGLELSQQWLEKMDDLINKHNEEFGAGLVLYTVWNETKDKVWDKWLERPNSIQNRGFYADFRCPTIFGE